MHEEAEKKTGQLRAVADELRSEWKVVALCCLAGLAAGIYSYQDQHGKQEAPSRSEPIEATEPTATTYLPTTTLDISVTTASVGSGQ